MLAVAYNAWRITPLTRLPAWALVLAAAALGAGVWLSWRGLRGEPQRARRGLLLGLRVLAAVLVLALLLEPGLELRAETRVRARVALLLDTSRSMRLPATPGGASRVAEMLAWLQSHRPELARLGERAQLDVYGFDHELQSQDLDKLATAAAAAPPAPAGASAGSGPEALASGPSTDLAGALQAAGRAGASGRPLAGVIVASDGADNVELAAGLTAAAKESLVRLGAPVFALPVGAAADKDLAIEKVAVDDFAFVRSQVSVDVTVSANGFGPLDVPVVLKRDGQVVAARKVHLAAGRSSATVKLQFLPDQTGKFAFRVSVPVQPGESVVENNARAFAFKVIRDRVRVLLVVGHPSWDVRFLRQLLRRDPNVDLISFFILRTPGDDAHSSQEELSLIPFPTQEIFQEQIKTFDLIVFQDFGNRPWYHMSQYLDGIAEYVRDGGALALIGGEQAFSASDFTGTAIEPLLPAELLPAGSPPFDEVPARAQLTEAGKRHPMTELVAGAAQNERAWSLLPALPGLNGLGPLRPGAQMLLKAADGRPLLVVGQAGRGRTLALTTDASWRWSFVAAGQDLGARAYETFWQNAIRWLVRDPALTPMRLAAEKPSFDPEGEPPALDAQVRGSDYGAAAGAQLSVMLSSADDPLPRPAGTVRAGSDGNARIQLPPLPPGAYKARVTAKGPDGAPIGEAEEAFVVASASPELLRPAPRPDLLQAVADATGGKVIGQRDNLAELPLRDPGRVEVGQRTTRPLWDTWGVLVALCAVVGVEWTLRRRWGYA